MVLAMPQPAEAQIEASASDLMQKIDAVSTAQKAQHANIQKAKSRAIDAADAKEKSRAINDALESMGGIDISERNSIGRSGEK
ncbi:MAG: hypothetical protein HQL33_01925 [Alphaproteobacteria bacterium]|nr:hypothetical protein [Alphaproteobacteria bacterium]